MAFWWHSLCQAFMERKSYNFLPSFTPNYLLRWDFYASPQTHLKLQYQPLHLHHLITTYDLEELLLYVWIVGCTLGAHHSLEESKNQVYRKKGSKYCFLRSWILDFHSHFYLNYCSNACHSVQSICFQIIHHVYNCYWSWL